MGRGGGDVGWAGRGSWSKHGQAMLWYGRSARKHTPPTATKPADVGVAKMCVGREDNVAVDMKLLKKKSCV